MIALTKLLAKRGDDVAEPTVPQPSAALNYAGRVRLRTLVLARWVAIIGQTTAILIVYFFLKYDFPIAATLITVGASVVLNVFLALRYPVSKRLTDGEAAGYLVYDTLQLAVLLFLTGGLHNPFSFLLLTAVIISAAGLSVRTTIKLIGLLLIIVSVLMFVHLPLPWPEGLYPPSRISHLPPPWSDKQHPIARIIHLPIPGPGGEHSIAHIYVFGIWSALVVGMLFFAANVMRVAEEGRRMSDALMETQMVLAREQQLSAVGGLAAAAAHELGTPLGTIAVVAKELSSELPADSPYTDDVKLLLSQSERCREILARLTLSSENGTNLSFDRLPFMSLVEMASSSQQIRDVEVTVEHDPGLVGEPGRGRENKAMPALAQPLVPHRLEIIHGLGNLVENAMDFARTRVSIKVGWSESKVVVEITDDGPGFERDILGAIGEPYVSTRRESGGMGLGAFIAKTLLERTGAEIEFGNRKESGARIVVTWPRELFGENIPASVDAPDIKENVR